MTFSPFCRVNWFPVFAMVRSIVCAAGFVCFVARSSFAADPFPVEPFPFPYRSVAADGDVSAIRFNPASLGMREDVEFSWHHKFSGNPTGFNAYSLRAKGLGLSASWLDDATFGKRREYLLAAGHRLSGFMLLGATFRWLKADDSLLQNRTTWTFAAAIAPAPAWTAAARWENALHTTVGGQDTQGLWVFGLRASPLGDRAEITLDWFYPEWASPADTDVRLAVKFRPTLGINLRGFIDTQERVGLELELAVERSKAGSEIRYTDYSQYEGGTLYVSVLNGDYPGARKR